MKKLVLNVFIVSLIVGAQSVYADERADQPTMLDPLMIEFSAVAPTVVAAESKDQKQVEAAPVVVAVDDAKYPRGIKRRQQE